MNKIPINVCVFDTSKGHWGKTDIFEKCITDLSNHIPLNNFEKLYVHIKVGNGEEEIAAKMEKWYSDRGFKVVKTSGQFSHFSLNHQQEYCKDIVTAFGDDYLSAPYTLWLESDWCWDAKGEDLIKRFYETISLLSYDKDILSVRFPRFLNEVDRLNNLKKKHNLDVQCLPHADFSNFYIHNDNFSCNPNICRTRDLYLASLVLKRNFEQFSHHSEMGWTKCLSWMSDSKYPYAIFNPDKVSVLHYGTPENQQDIVGKVFEKID